MIFVDDLHTFRNPLYFLNKSRKPWCRMQSNENISTLRHMAEHIGVPPEYCSEGRVSFYVLNAAQRMQAISLGAIAVTGPEMNSICFHPDSERSQQIINEKILHVDAKRERSAHVVPFKPEYSKNEEIMKWWTPEHDDLLAKQIEIKHWVWHYEIYDKIAAITPLQTLEHWKSTSSLCKKYAWYNILWNFAAARAEELNLTTCIRKPARMLCPLCQRAFTEDSVRYTFVKRLGLDQIDICDPCLADTLYQSAAQEVSREYVLDYLQELASALQSIPSQDYGDGESDLRKMTTEERVVVLQIIRRRPLKGKVKALFGSWLNALIEADILEDGTRRTSRGTQCLAKDGHVCLSLGEKTIDDFLYGHGIVLRKSQSTLRVITEQISA